MNILKFSAVNHCRFEFIGNIVVVEVKLSDHLYNLNYYYSILGQDEIERYARYAFESDRARLVITWAILRLFLSDYDSRSCNKIRFRRNEWGKPELLSNNGRTPVMFSISHSYDRIIYAFSMDMAIGIDIEKVSNTGECDAIVKRFFSCQEQEFFFQIPVAERTRMFFRLWSMKEAVLKADGKGLSMSMSKFSVAPIPNGEVIFAEPYSALNGKMKVIELGGDFEYSRALCHKVVC